MVCAVQTEEGARRGIMTAFYLSIAGRAARASPAFLPVIVLLPLLALAGLLRFPNQ